MPLSKAQKLAKDQFDTRYKKLVHRINLIFEKVESNGSNDLHETAILVSDLIETLKEQQIPFSQKEPDKLLTFAQSINSCFSFIDGLLNDLEKLLEEQSQTVSKS